MLRNAVVVVIEDDFGRVLFGKRAAGDSFPGVWNPFSGEVEEGEELAEACRREVLEETGLVIEVEAKFFESTTTRANFILHWFRARHVAGELRLDASEIEAVRWIGARDLGECELLFRDTAELFERYWRSYARNKNTD